MSRRRLDRQCLGRARSAGGRRLIATAVVLGALLNGSAATAARPAPCDLRLVVGLSPDVLDPSDVGFLSSLLGNHPSYGLTLMQQLHGTVIVAELTGPGPEYICDNVIDAMRKDGRVLFVHVHEGPV